MNDIYVDRVPVVESEWLFKPASELEANVTAPTIVHDAATGEAIVYLARMERGPLGELRRALLNYPKSVSFRAGGFRNTAAGFGYTARNPVLRREGCRGCVGIGQAPDAHFTIASTAGVLAGMLRDALPEQAAADIALVHGAVHPDWLLDSGAPWTSGVVNWLSPLPYHYDRNNFDAWSAMPVVRREVSGGHLHIPALGLVIDCRDGDVLFFNGNRHMHGVTPMRRTRPSGYRISAVYYPVARMAKCLPAAQELARGRAKRSGREDDLIERQRAGGTIR